MGAIAGSIDNYTKRDGGLIYFRPTRFGTASKANEYVNGMTPDNARAVAAELTRLADEAEQPQYTPGKVYTSMMGNRYLATNDGRFMAFAGGTTGPDWAGCILDASALTRPLTEEGI